MSINWTQEALSVSIAQQAVQLALRAPHAIHVALESTKIQIQMITTKM